MRWVRLSWLMLAVAVLAACGTTSADSPTATLVFPTLPVAEPSPTPVPTTTPLPPTPTALVNNAPSDPPTPTPTPVTLPTATVPPATPTPTAIPAPTSILFQPTPTPVTVLTLDPETRFDGRWVGLTDQGTDFSFELEQGRLLWLNIDLTVTGCGKSISISRQFPNLRFGLDFEGQDSFQVDFTEPYDFSIQLALRQGSDSYGLVLFSTSNPCGQGLTSDIRFAPEGLFVAVPPTPTPVVVENPEELAPEVTLPEEVFDKEHGADHIDQVTIIAEEGDWLIVQSHDSVVPVPKGWTTAVTPSEDLVLLFAPGGVTVTGDPDTGLFYNPRPEITITVNQVIADEYHLSSDAIADIQDLVTYPRGGTVFDILDSAIVDDNRAYLVFSVTEFSLPTVHQVIVLSNNAVGGLEPGEPVVWSVTIAEIDSARWEDYYPVVRAIIANWASASDGTLRGVNLPEEAP